jgi:hypothetical protein
MKKLAYAILSSLVLTPALHAVLPPLYQSADEIKAILNSEELEQRLTAGDVIMLIRKNDNGYTIISNKHQLQVDVINQPSYRPGPTHFKLQFHDAVPLEAQRALHLDNVHEEA